MKFFEYRSMLNLSRMFGAVDKSIGYKEFYQSAIQMLSQRAMPRGTMNQIIGESFWYNDNRPYYLVYPSIIPMLTKLNLECDSGEIELPLQVLMIRLPEERNPLKFMWEDKEYTVRTILALKGEVGGNPGLICYIDIDEWNGPLDLAYTYRNIECVKGLTIEESLSRLPIAPSAGQGVQMPLEVAADCIRIVCCITLLAKDSELITPDVLNEDAEKFEKTRDQKYVIKAKKRGKYGWAVGKMIEVIPHIRRPHLALFWTGKGRTKPVVQMRKGSLIHKDQIKKVPTDYEKEEE